MADERDEWLDQDAAERLLRGEPAGPVDDHAREQARRVARALDALRAAAAPAAGALPGEEAALAAFREARADRAAGARRAVTASSGRPAASDGPEPGAVVPRRRMRWARPVRWGLAASVAGLAAGGVAVAAGTGVLPVLGGDSEPLPAASVSAAATPETSVSGEPTGGPDSATPGRSGEPGSVPPSASRTPGAGTEGAERVPGRPDHGRTGGTGDDDPSGGWPGGDLGGAEGGTGSVSGSDSGDTWFARTVQDCRDYRDGRMDRERREELEAEADGAAKLKALCDKVLAGEAEWQNSTGSGSQGAGSGSGSGDGGDGGKDEGPGGKGGDDSDAARPSVSWYPQAPALSVRRTGLVF
ncbi:hypothetical protein ACFT5C_17135 [Streptomyces sp. NPDC057116]|uniref:hypothetical protein n=1 Tax=Streptomyces sp. NPDC057116 TaxID=3346023 RepID=UPI00363B254B